MIRQHWIKYSLFSATIFSGLYFSRNLKDRNIRMGIAGLLGQMTTDIIFHPIDVVNTRTKFFFSEKLNIRQMAKKIYGSEGLFGIFRGGTIMLWGSAFSGFVYFSVYRRLKEFFKKKFGEKKGWNTLTYVLSAMLTQSVVYPLAYPIDLVKTRVQTGEYNYVNIQDGIKKIYQNSKNKSIGILKDYWVGFTPNYSLNVAASILVFLTFESTRDFIAQRRGISSHDVKGLDYFICTFVAGTITAVTLNFLEVYSIQKCIHGDKISFKEFLSKDNIHALRSGISARLFSGIFYTIMLLESVNIYGKIFRTHL